MQSPSSVVSAVMFVRLNHADIAGINEVQEIVRLQVVILHSNTICNAQLLDESLRLGKCLDKEAENLTVCCVRVRTTQYCSTARTSICSECMPASGAKQQ